MPGRLLQTFGQNMAYNVYLATPAQNELESAVEYLALRTASPHVIRRLLNDYEMAIGALETNPFAYPIDLAATEALGQEIRKIRVKPYRLFYRILASRNDVEIISFLHTRQNIAGHILEDYGERY